MKFFQAIGAALFAFALLAQPARASWPAGGILVSAVGESPVIASDASGFVVAWVQSTPSTPGVFVQRFTGGGEVAPGWPAGGVRACTTSVYPRQAVSDGGGGAYLAWLTGGCCESMTLVVQRVGGAGTIPSGWPACGRAASDGAGQHDPQMIADGAGGCVIVWRDSRMNVAGGSGILAQRILPSGENGPTLPARGRVLVSQQLDETNARPSLSRDPAWGYWLAYRKTRTDASSPFGFFVSRLTDSLEHRAPWNEGDLPLGVPDVPTVDGRNVPPTPSVPDGLGGAFFATHGNSLRWHHVVADGSLDPAWPAGGTVVEAAPRSPSGFFPADEAWPIAVPDGAGGAYLIWGIDSAYPQLVGSRLDASGVAMAGWSTPIPLLGSFRTSVIADTSGVYASGWLIRDCPHFSCTGGGFIAHRLADGTEPEGWQSAPAHPFEDAPGIEIVPGDINNDSAQLASDHSGGAFAAWRAGAAHLGSQGIRVTRFTRAGRLAGAPTAPPAELAIRSLHWAAAGAVARIALPRAGSVRLELFDVAGRRLALAAVEADAPGEIDVRLTGIPRSAGVVFARLRLGALVAASRVTMLR